MKATSKILIKVIHINSDKITSIEMLTINQKLVLIQKKYPTSKIIDIINGLGWKQGNIIIISR